MRELMRDNDQSEHRELKTLMDATFDEILITDSEGRVILVNDRCKRLYNLTRDEIVGKSVFDLEASRLFTPSATKQVLRDKRRVVVLQETCEGRKLVVTAWPVLDDNGVVLRVVNVARDITEISNLEQELIETQELLRTYRAYVAHKSAKELEEEGLTYRSKAMERVIRLVHQVASSQATVLLLGESGTGKEVLARLLHRESAAANGPFIPVNCSAVPEALFESEMFGYEEGAFSGAKRKGKIGLIDASEGGTLFLDEVGEMPLSVQAKLLRFLQDRTYFRVGATKPLTAKVRIVAATNRDLMQFVKEGKFREDLYYRLNVVSVDIPPLRDRRDDIIPLCHYFLKKFTQLYTRDRYIDSGLTPLLENYTWPGNIRELQNTIERAVIVSEHPRITETDLPETIWQAQARLKASMGAPLLTLQEAVEETERAVLRNALQMFATTHEMAKNLGVNQSTIVRKLQKYALSTIDKGKNEFVADALWQSGPKTQ